MLLFEQKCGAVECPTCRGCGLLSGWIVETMAAMHNAARGGALEAEEPDEPEAPAGPGPPPRLVRRAPGRPPILFDSLSHTD